MSRSDRSSKRLPRCPAPVAFGVQLPEEREAAAERVTGPRRLLRCRADGTWTTAAQLDHRVDEQLNFIGTACLLHHADASMTSRTAS